MSCIHDENGQVLEDEVEVTERWKEHFKGLYGDMEWAGQEVPHSEATEEDDLEITLEEVRKCVERLKMRKAPGECGGDTREITGRRRKGDEMVVDVVQNGMGSRSGPR